MMITTQRLWLHVFLIRQGTLSEKTYSIAEFVEDKMNVHAQQFLADWG